MSSTTPRIIVIGAGRFGRQHLLEWQRLAAEGRAILAGIVVRTEASRRQVEAQFGVPAFSDLESALALDVDAVDVVTPSDTHFDVVQRCLPHTHVLVEKPAAMDARRARELTKLARSHGRHFMVGHVYRFHPLVHELKRLLDGVGTLPQQIMSTFTNPPTPGIEDLDPRLEFLHPFDIIDYLFGVAPVFGQHIRHANTCTSSIRYQGPVNATVETGWRGSRKCRTLNLRYDDRKLFCDFIDNSIVIHTNDDDDVEKIFLAPEQSALRNELCAFLSLLRGDSPAYPDGDKAAAVIDAATGSSGRAESPRPRVAVIGGGIFGATCAIELGDFCDVTVFERHGELLTEASFYNQWRHHSGFHYPRSPQTVDEVKESRDDFMARYREIIHTGVDCYYGTSATAREITAERYVAACEGNGLSFEHAYPPPGVLREGTVSVCLKTDESVVDYHAFKALLESQLASKPGITVLRNTEVLDGEFGPDGEKRLTFRSGTQVRHEDFDFLVNATYANRNLAAKWFQFPPRALRHDLVELLVLEVDLPRVSVTILDGPFTSITSMGQDRMFMLSSIHDSVLKSIVREEAPAPEWARADSNRHNLLRHATTYLPALADAKVVESRIGVRTVYAYSDDFDGRPTVVTDHGFGCWSVLGGKIITCVSNAQEIAAEIRNALRSTRAAGPVASKERAEREWAS
ncbi:MAG: FAD-dependent oxidoreductase [Gammaproteobacteria bacterium]|nr:FAD-dependent oxidoreductase [Gammaproteobacteria bacterium]